MEKAGSKVSQGLTPSTTFVQADTSTFREVVQRLTGPSDGDHQASTATPSPTIHNAANEGAGLKVTGVKRPTFKLYERRQYTRSKLEILKPAGIQSKPSGSPVLLQSSKTGLRPTKQLFSPSIASPLGTPSKTFSNLSISSSSEEEEEEEKPKFDLNCEEEEKAIKERRFYLHPSPRSRPGNAEPELLPLFPLNSPKIAYQS